MFFYLKISCKNKKILKKFVNFFTKTKSLPIFIKPFSKNKKRKFVTVLKSPHINKTAQEQFEYRFFSKHFLVFSFKPLIFFLILKRLKNFSFSGIKIEIIGIVEKDKNNKYAVKIINPDNVIFRNLHFKQNDINLLRKYIQLFDSYGEICLQNIFYS